MHDASPEAYLPQLQVAEPDAFWQPNSEEHSQELSCPLAQQMAPGTVAGLHFTSFAGPRVSQAQASGMPA